ncbi:5079_t:CDS:2, partial [Ambispora gerdemannii]
PTNISPTELIQQHADNLSWRVVDRATKTESGLNLTFSQLVKIIEDARFDDDQGSIAPIPLENNTDNDKKRNIPKRTPDPEHVENTDADSYITVGHIGSGCTGTLIGPNAVLTAGHCVYDGTNWYGNLDFSPGQNGPDPDPNDPDSDPKFDKINWIQDRASKSKLRLCADYFQEINTGWRFNWEGYPGDKVTNFRLVQNRFYHTHIAHYKHNKPHWTMWHEFCPRLRDVDELLFEHFGHTAKGTSGSGLYLFLEPDFLRIYGVVSHHVVRLSFPVVGCLPIFVDKPTHFNQILHMRFYDNTYLKSAEN